MQVGCCVVLVGGVVQYVLDEQQVWLVVGVGGVECFEVDVVWLLWYWYDGDVCLVQVVEQQEIVWCFYGYCVVRVQQCVVDQVDGLGVVVGCQYVVGVDGDVLVVQQCCDVFV